MPNWRVQVDVLVEADTSAAAQALVERQMARLAMLPERAEHLTERKTRYRVGMAIRAAAPAPQLKPRRQIIDPQGPIRSKRSA